MIIEGQLVFLEMVQLPETVQHSRPQWTQKEDPGVWPWLHSSGDLGKGVADRPGRQRLRCCPDQPGSVVILLVGKSIGWSHRNLPPSAVVIFISLLSCLLRFVQLLLDVMKSNSLPPFLIFIQFLLSDLLSSYFVCWKGKFNDCFCLIPNSSSALIGL